MADLKKVFSTFFLSDSSSVGAHKKALIKESVHKEYKKYNSDMYKFAVGTYKSPNQESIELMREAFQGMVSVFDMYGNEKTKKLEEKMVTILENATPENARDSAAELQATHGELIEELEANGAPADIFEDEYANVEELEAQLKEEDVPPTEQPVSEPAPAPPAEEIEDGVSDGNGDEALTGYESGFNEGRKRYDVMKKEGMSPAKYSRQLAETELAERSYAWVEKWIRGFNEGVKFQETIMREKNPEMFSNEEGVDK